MSTASTADLLALSVRQPWTHAIIHLGKPVENRGRRFKHRGLTLIHASAGMDVEEWADAAEFMRSFNVTPPRMEALARGGIIGAVEIVDCVEEHPSPWFTGPYGLVMAKPRAIPFIPCKGTVCPLFWRPPADVLRAARAALRLPD